MNSVVDRQNYATYHYQEHRRLLTENIDAKLDVKSVFELTFPLTAEQYAETNWLLKRVEANVLACLQSMHAQLDIFAHVIYFALGLNVGTSALRERDVGLRSVLLALDAKADCEGIASLLRAVSTHDSFLYLSALVNHSKHRSIVVTVLRVGFKTSGEAPYELVFEEFAYSGAQYSQRGVLPFLEPTYSLLSTKVVDCGVELNAVLRSRDA